MKVGMMLGLFGYEIDEYISNYDKWYINILHHILRYWCRAVQKLECIYRSL